MEPMLIRPDEAAKILGLGRSKVYEMLAAGQLPVIRIGRSVRVPLQPLKEWGERQTGGAGVTSDGMGES